MGETTGQYSVKYGYRLIHEDMVSIASPIVSNSIWQNVWKAKALPKMSNLVWRALVNCLPTCANLKCKRVVECDLCPTCQSGEETVLHALVTCSFAQKVWRCSSIGWFYGNSTDFASWLGLVFNKTDRLQWGLVIAICWLCGVTGIKLSGKELKCKLGR